MSGLGSGSGSGLEISQAELTQPSTELLLPSLKPLATLLALDLLPGACLLSLTGGLCCERLERSTHPPALQPAAGDGLEVSGAVKAGRVAEESGAHLVRGGRGGRQSGVCMGCGKGAARVRQGARGVGCVGCVPAKQRGAYPTQAVRTSYTYYGAYQLPCVLGAVGEGLDLSVHA